MFLPKWLQVTLGGGVPLTLQSNRALRPSITSKTSKLRVKRGSREGMTLSLPHEVTSSEKGKKYLLSRNELEVINILLQVLHHACGIYP